MCLHISTCISSVPCKSKMDMRSTHGEDVPRCILQAACVARMKGKHSGGCMSKNMQRPFCVFKQKPGGMALSSLPGFLLPFAEGWCRAAVGGALRTALR